MIATKAQLKEYILWDSKANRRESTRCKLFGDECWKYQVILRKLDYYTTRKKKNPLLLPMFLYYKFRHHNLGVKLGFSIPCNIMGKGFSLPHYGTIIIGRTSRLGENCRIQEDVNIGGTSGTGKTPILGNNVFVGTGSKLLGDITIADGVCIGANSVVIRSITEPNTTWAGAPARKISDKSSRANLAYFIESEG